MTLSEVKTVSPVIWLALAVALGAFAMSYHSFTRDDTDDDWTRSKEEGQPPIRAAYPGQNHSCRPMDTCCGFRQRAYPDSLAAASFSIIGEI